MGYTDNEECDTGKYPQVNNENRIPCNALATSRSGIVELKLIVLGVDVDLFTGSGVGNLDPIALEDSDKNRVHNRAVQFIDVFEEARRSNHPFVEIPK